MPKSEIIASVLSHVSEETEISREEILSSCRQQEVVDARHLAIVLMSEMGVYARQIASVFGVSARNVYSVKINFDARLLYNRQLAVFKENILKKLRSKFEMTAK